MCTKNGQNAESQRCTLCVLNGSHLSYVAEEAEPGWAALRERLMNSRVWRVTRPRIWKSTKIWRSAYLLSTDSVLCLSVLMEVRISEYGPGLSWVPWLLCTQVCSPRPGQGLGLHTQARWGYKPAINHKHSTAVISSCYNIVYPLHTDQVDIWKFVLEYLNIIFITF